MTGYTIWSFHGDDISSNTTVTENVTVDEEDEDIVNMHDILQDAFPGQTFEGVGVGTTSGHTDEIRDDSQKLHRLMQEAEKALYPECNEFTKLSFTVALYHIKCLCNWSDKSFSMLLDLLKKALPQGNTLPNSLYEAKKMVKDLGLSYNKIDACPNDCMLYWKDASNEKSCRICGASRYESKSKVPEKTLRHFPLIPRVQRLYRSSVTSSDMRWHKDGRIDDGKIRHPADAEAWKDFDRQHPTFSADPRNVRLGIASDGFNPFNMKNSYSMWPVVVVPYNLPPWKCMKQTSFMLTLLIPGPNQPGNDIDVYLQPLIDELKLLWDGVDTYDALKKESFRLRACLLWTINDFPAYANLSGWSTKGALACPCCNKDTMSTWLKHSRKHCYLGHRRFLKANHQFRLDKRGFNGSVEFGLEPQPLSGTALLAQMEGVKFPTFGKEPKKDNANKRKRVVGRNELPFNWKKRSLFFELPYWKDNLLCHNLDVMHIEKNVCDNIIDTLLELKGRSKDKLEARLDLKDMNIRPSLHPQRIEGSSKVIVPPASHTMSKVEKEQFCKALEGLKVPDGYSGNISRYVKVTERDISGMKSHDCHVLMQQLLPLAIRVHPMNNVKLVLLSVCGFFRCLCAKIATKDDLNQLKANIVETLCNLERIFPPTFFDVMVHLLVHLPREVLLGGPVHYRWMYPFERFNKTLKDYKRNNRHVEGSIAEGYIANECLTFCSAHIKVLETRLTRPNRNVDNENLQMEQQHWIFSCKGRPLGAATMVQLDWKNIQQAHRYVLLHYEPIDKYRK
ncbi:uncharacterized protein LOC122644951 [Telopea speciosissima]|uniref:uncharacterized protein LOC122644951 n=1 Tax=Telopea speciosissima TaxID=54955 RepID=UPI001CC3B25A|nr:uncharacterized protein LOC122644951 [Telopea speciosissima]